MIFDAHGDILTDMFEQSVMKNENSFSKRHLELYKQGGITHSIFVNWTDPQEENPQVFNDIFNAALTEIKHNPDIFQICYNHQDMLESEKRGKLGIILGIEGIKNLRDIPHLEDLYNKGIRHASLTWNEANKYANGLDNDTDGLTKEGFKVIEKMEELGMIIDLAHSNKHTFDDIINHTTKPVIISHGNTKALCNHRRNYTDEQLFQIKEKNGVIGICAIPAFVSSEEQNQTVAYMAKHIKYVKDLIGIDHVGIGFDLCYYLFGGRVDNGLDGLRHMNDAPNLFVELQKLGFSETEIEQVKHLNFERVIKEILG
jgi:membrane dipeptidase